MRKTAILLVFVVLVSGCMGKEEMSEEKITSNPNAIPLSECIAACKQVSSLENGPCLLDPVPSNPMWVCDVAHTPRITVDSRPENQCQSYRNGSATHFIEVTPNCEMIRIV